MASYWNFFLDVRGGWRWRYAFAGDPRVIESPKVYADKRRCLAAAMGHGYPGKWHEGCKRADEEAAHESA